MKFAFSSSIWRIGLTNGSISKPLKLTHNACNVIRWTYAHICAYWTRKERISYENDCNTHEHTHTLFFGIVYKDHFSAGCVSFIFIVCTRLFYILHLHTLFHSISRKIVSIWYCLVKCFVKWNLIQCALANFVLINLCYIVTIKCNSGWKGCKKNRRHH